MSTDNTLTRYPDPVLPIPPSCARPASEAAVLEFFARAEQAIPSGEDTANTFSIAEIVAGTGLDWCTIITACIYLSDGWARDESAPGYEARLKPVLAPVGNSGDSGIHYTLNAVAATPKSPRPNALPPIFENFPAELTERAQWVVWKYVWREDAKDARKSKWTKPPFNARTGGVAKSNDASTWSTFAQSRAAYEKGAGAWDGVGFMLHPDAAIVGIDFDKCAPGGELTDDTARMVTALDTYTEWSPSSVGIRCFALGTLPEGHGSRNAKREIEIYDSIRFLTVTGHRLATAPLSINVRTEAMAAFLAEVFPPEPLRERSQVQMMRPVDQSSADLLEVAFRSKNGAKIRALYGGDTSSYPGASEADMAFCSLLAFYTGGEYALLDGWYRASGLMRDKWDEKHYAGGVTYGDRTVQKTVDAQAATGFYTPPTPRNGGFAGSRSDHTGSPSELSKASPREQITPVTFDPIVPLGENIVPPFPVDALTPWFGAFVDGVATDTQTPPDMAAMMGLAALATCVQKKAVLRVKNNWYEPLNLYTVTVLGPANRKSAVVSAVVKPLQIFEKERRESLRPEIAKKKSMRNARQEQLKEAEKLFARAKTPEEEEMAASEIGTKSAILDALPETGEYRIFTEDTTPERLASLLADNGGRMSCMAAEGQIFDVMVGRYAKGSPNLGVFLNSHSGETLLVDRIGRKGDRVESPALTLGLAIQPDVIRGLMAQEALRGRGMLARLLFCLPQDRLGFRDVDAPPVSHEVTMAWREGIMNLLLLPMVNDEHGKPTASHVLSLSTPAVAVLREYQIRVEQELRPGADFGDIQDWGGKLCGAVARIAGLLHLADGAMGHGFIDGYPALEVPAATMARAIQIGDYLTAHAHAAFAEMGADTTRFHAELILAWMQRQKWDGDGPHSFKLSDLYNSLHRRFKQSGEMDAPLQLLADRNYLRINAPTDEERRHNAKGTATINPLFSQQTPSNGLLSGAFPTFLTNPTL